MEGKIDANRAFCCFICKKIAYQPVVRQCCNEYIMCIECIAPCPNCKATKTYKSPLLQTIYSNVILPCIYGCSSVLTLKNMKAHTAQCPESTMQCPYCKEKIKTKQLPDHMGTIHQEECSRLLIEFHKKEEEEKKPVGSLPPALNLPKINPFKYGVNTGDIRICVYGRLVCGKNMQFLMNSGLKQGLLCSPELGSCNNCMQMDVQRLGLPRNYLLNFEGRVCYVFTEKAIAACGVMIEPGMKICNEAQQCKACKSIPDFIRAGLYRSLLQIPQS